MKNLIDLMDYILYDIFKKFFEYIIKIHEKCAYNSTVYIDKTENRITFKIKNTYYLELLTPEIMKLIRSSQKSQLKIKNVKLSLIQKLLE